MIRFGTLLGPERRLLHERLPMRIALLGLVLLAGSARADDLPPGAVLRIGSSALRHQNQLRQVAWSHDGKRLISSSDYERVKVWDPATGKLLASFPAHFHEVAFALAGNIL